MRRATALGLVAYILCIATSSAQVIELHKDAQWSLDNYSGFNNVSIHNITVPSYALELLQERGIIGDPLFRFNEREYSWVAADTWTFFANFTPPSTLLSSPRQILTLHGIDTAASISINGFLIGNISNAHRRHIFELPTDLLRQGISNSLSITLRPAAAFAAEQAAGYPYPVPYTKQLGNTGQYNFIRKPAADYGWDWGPSFSPSGISGGITLQSGEISILTDVGLTQRHHPNGSVTLTAEAFFLPGGGSEQGELTVRVRGPVGGSEGSGRGGRGNERFVEKGGAVDQWSATVAVNIAPEAAVDWASSFVHGGSDTSDTCSSLKNTKNAAEETEEEPEGLGGGVQARRTPLGHVVQSVAVEVTSLQLWWPWDLNPGGQALYEVTIEYSISSTNKAGFIRLPGAGGSQAAEAPQRARTPPRPQIINKRVGFRTVELITQPTGFGNGETFSFKVNGVPLWARGANVVPLDIIETRVNSDKIESIVAAARAANMNMLRVWGGGRYFQETFYNACDETGILVWQEFMFACACYPRDEAFLLDVAEEARQQTLRLSSHPSVAVWGGNNENEASFTWFQESKTNRALYAVDFSVLFVDLLRKIVAHIDQQAIYLDTSPSNGLLSKHPYIKRWGDVTDPSVGDVHFYDYVSNLLFSTSYPPAKFVSEFGYMSYPSLESFAREADFSKGDWGVDSELLKYRMRHANGLEEIQRQLNMHYGDVAGGGGAGTAAAAKSADVASKSSGGCDGNGALSPLSPMFSTPDLWSWLFPNKCLAPLNASDSHSDDHRNKEEEESFRRFTYLTQIQQALIYSTAASRWRRGKSDPSIATSGLLYWQLNDVWAGPSWSGINKDGRWKPLHHAAQRFFAPVAVFGNLVGNSNPSMPMTTTRHHNNKELEVEAHIVNDLPVAIKCTLTVELVPYRATSSDEVIILVENLEVEVPASAAVVAWRSHLQPSLLKDSSLDKLRDVSTSCFIRFKYTPYGIVNNNGTLNNTSSWGLWQSIAGPSYSELLLVEAKDADLSRVAVVVESVSSLAYIKKQPDDAALEGLEESESNLEESTMPSGSSPPPQPHSLEVALRAQGGTALLVVLESLYAGTFSDNMFSLAPWETKRITFMATNISEDSVSVDPLEFRDSLRVTWLQEALASSGRAVVSKKVLALAVLFSLAAALFLTL